MTPDSFASALYLGLLGVAILGTYLVSSRQSLGKTVQQLAIWALIFIGFVAIGGMWDDIRDQVAPRQSIAMDGESLVVPRSFDGHYHMRLGINGTPVRFVVDTGATDMVLSRADAARVGIDPDALAYTGRAQTANGTVPLARVVLDEVSIGGVTERRVPATVNGGEMDGSLLGMSYLSRFGRIEIEGDRLTLTR